LAIRASAGVTSVPPESMMSSIQDAGKPGDVADHVHDLGFAGALAAAVEDGERGVDAFGQPRARTTHRRRRTTMTLEGRSAP